MTHRPDRNRFYCRPAIRRDRDRTCAGPRGLPQHPRSSCLTKPHLQSLVPSRAVRLSPCAYFFGLVGVGGAGRDATCDVVFVPPLTTLPSLIITLVGLGLSDIFISSFFIGEFDPNIVLRSRYIDMGWLGNFGAVFIIHDYIT